MATRTSTTITMARTTHVTISRRTYRGRLDSVSMICLGMVLLPKRNVSPGGSTAHAGDSGPAETPGETFRLGRRTMPRQIIDTESSRPRYVCRLIVTWVVLAIVIVVLVLVAIAVY